MPKPPVARVSQPVFRGPCLAVRTRRANEGSGGVHWRTASSSPTADLGDFSWSAPCVRTGTRPALDRTRPWITAYGNVVRADHARLAHSLGLSTDSPGMDQR